MIIKLIKYVYYRISHVYDRKETPVNLWDYDFMIKDLYYIRGGMITAVLLLFNIDTILHILENHYIIYSDTTSLFRSKWFSIGFLLLGCFLSSKKSYAKLNEKYKNEKYRVFKGYLVVLYIVLTIVIYILTRVLNL